MTGEIDWEKWQSEEMIPFFFQPNNGLQPNVHKMISTMTTG